MNYRRTEFPNSVLTARLNSPNDELEVVQTWTYIIGTQEGYIKLTPGIQGDATVRYPVIGPSADRRLQLEFMTS